MKKIIISILIAMLLVFSAACSEQTASTDSAAQETSDSVTQEATYTAEPVETETPAPEDSAETAPSDSAQETQAEDASSEGNTIILEVGGYTFTAALEDNTTGEALKEKLAEGSVTIDMHDYGNMEKVGGFGFSLPRNDEQITTEPGDLILYQGNAFVIYYAPNSWNFTRIGKIKDATAEELIEALGSGDVSVTLSLPQEQ